MTDWRAVKTLAAERDDCAKCRHCGPSKTGEVLLCTHPEVRAMYGRTIVAASVAMADGCGGRLWARADASRAHQSGAGSIAIEKMAAGSQPASAMRQNQGQSN